MTGENLSEQQENMLKAAYVTGQKSGKFHHDCGFSYGTIQSLVERDLLDAEWYNATDIRMSNAMLSISAKGRALLAHRSKKEG